MRTTATTVATTATTEQDRSGTAGDTRLVTSCGRPITVKCLRLETADRPIRRVTLDVGRAQGGEPGMWAALTPAEARDLARLLLIHAGVAETS
ncbi:hypothetical protein [Streptomyces sp. NPDC005209]|uniref:hypothetical protein n=1 Tax=Streptomyces sp. NPDC005209 TaxID=3156715 RepID=UPI0033ADCF97